MHSYLILDSPRVGSLGYRIIVNVGCAPTAYIEECLERSRQQPSAPDILVVSHIVKQYGQSTIVAREGVERLLLISAQLTVAEPIIRERVGELLNSILQQDVEQLLADPELPGMARDRIIIEHPLLSSWLRRVDALLHDRTDSGNDADIAPTSQTWQRQQPSPSQPESASQTIPNPPPSILPPRTANNSHKILCVGAAILTLLLAGTLKVGHLRFRQSTNNHPANSCAYEERYEWLPDYIRKPVTDAEVKRFEERLNDCWMDLVNFIKANNIEHDNVKKINARDFPVWAGFIKTRAEWTEIENDSAAEIRYKRIDAVITNFKEALQKANNKDLKTIASANACYSEFLQNIYHRHNSDKPEESGPLKMQYAHFNPHPSPEFFLNSAYKFFKWQDI